MRAVSLRDYFYGRAYTIYLHVYGKIYCSTVGVTLTNEKTGNGLCAMTACHFAIHACHVMLILPSRGIDTPCPQRAAEFSILWVLLLWFYLVCLFFHFVLEFCISCGKFQLGIDRWFLFRRIELHVRIIRLLR